MTFVSGLFFTLFYYLINFDCIGLVSIACKINYSTKDLPALTSAMSTYNPWLLFADRNPKSARAALLESDFYARVAGALQIVIALPQAATNISPFQILGIRPWINILF